MVSAWNFGRREEQNKKMERTAGCINCPVLGQQVGHLVRCLCNRTSPFFWSTELLLHNLRPIIGILLYEVLLHSSLRFKSTIYRA